MCEVQGGAKKTLKIASSLIFFASATLFPRWAPADAQPLPSARTVRVYRRKRERNPLDNATYCHPRGRNSSPSVPSRRPRYRLQPVPSGCRQVIASSGKNYHPPGPLKSSLWARHNVPGQSFALASTATANRRNYKTVIFNHGCRGKFLKHLPEGPMCSNHRSWAARFPQWPLFPLKSWCRSCSGWQLTWRRTSVSEHDPGRTRLGFVAWHSVPAGGRFPVAPETIKPQRPDSLEMRASVVRS